MGAAGGEIAAQTGAHGHYRLNINELRLETRRLAQDDAIGRRRDAPDWTTHVSCGSLFGIGAVTRQARWKTIAGILAAWVVTLPMAAALAAIGYRLMGAVL